MVGRSECEPCARGREREGPADRPSEGNRLGHVEYLRFIYLGRVRHRSLSARATDVARDLESSGRLDQVVLGRQGEVVEDLTDLGLDQRQPPEAREEERQKLDQA